MIWTILVFRYFDSFFLMQTLFYRYLSSKIQRKLCLELLMKISCLHSYNFVYIWTLKYSSWISLSHFLYYPIYKSTCVLESEIMNQGDCKCFWLELLSFCNLFLLLFNICNTYKTNDSSLRNYVQGQVNRSPHSKSYFATRLHEKKFLLHFWTFYGPSQVNFLKFR